MSITLCLHYHFLGRVPVSSPCPVLGQGRQGERRKAGSQAMEGRGRGAEPAPGRGQEGPIPPRKKALRAPGRDQPPRRHRVGALLAPATASNTLVANIHVPGPLPGHQLLMTFLSLPCSTPLVLWCPLPVQTHHGSLPGSSGWAMRACVTQGPVSPRAGLGGLEHCQCPAPPRPGLQVSVQGSVLSSPCSGITAGCGRCWVSTPPSPWTSSGNLGHRRLLFLLFNSSIEGSLTYNQPCVSRVQCDTFYICQHP